MATGNRELATGNWVSSQFNCIAIFTCQRRQMMPCHNVKWIILVCKSIPGFYPHVCVLYSIHTRGMDRYYNGYPETVAFVCPSLSATFSNRNRFMLSMLTMTQRTMNCFENEPRTVNKWQMDTEYEFEK